MIIIIGSILLVVLESIISFIRIVHITVKLNGSLLEMKFDH